MNYELAKELKEAGFPKIAFDVIGEQPNGVVVINKPTLSELIEACGDNLYSLYNHGQSWEVHSNSDQWDTLIKAGSTPEEAVARLWLALNKK
jgi:hypothetical protein